MTIEERKKDMKETKLAQASIIIGKSGKDGKEHRSSKTFSRINPAVENEKLYNTMKKLGELQIHTVKAVRRMNIIEMTDAQ